MAPRPLPWHLEAGLPLLAKAWGHQTQTLSLLCLQPTQGLCFRPAPSPWALCPAPALPAPGRLLLFPSTHFLRPSGLLFSASLDL